MPEVKDLKIRKMPYDYGNDMEFLADTLVKNLTLQEIMVLNDFLVKKANEKYNREGGK